MASISIASALRKSRNIFRSKEELRALEAEQSGQELLDQKFFAFQDLVQDDRLDEAVAFYEDPLRSGN
jgi:ankyrin repeat protein